MDNFEKKQKEQLHKYLVKRHADWKIRQERIMNAYKGRR